ncbi:hypothetical protein [Agrococcus sp. BE272]|uniref:alpha/beta hydrolase family protein n=1 Tax=Agrococcus sp. BE272 TaxID=2817727 RepID=UPI0028607555|nr:hypothetical protein [Agrococcus sp. BE272]MDR7233166.1 hypothetical protein [Agrococcus sp. BE272]
MDSTIDIGVDGLPLHVKLFERESSDSLLIFMPSAVAAGNVAHRHPSFARWQWESHFPQAHVLAVADPSMGIAQELRGAWYMHRDHDVIAAMAVAIERLIVRLGARRVVIYGSSLGGFGALALAACLPGAVAIAEVPQLDFGKWLQSARTAVETHILGRELEQHRLLHPEQVGIRARFEHASQVPSFVIISNVRDSGYREQLEFFEWVCAGAPRDDGTLHELRLVDQVLGHGPLGVQAAKELILGRLV